MGINEEQLELLVGELQKLRTNMSGMLDNSQQSRVTLERIDKTLVDQNKKTTDDDTISYEQDDSNADDMKKVIEAQQDLVNRAKQEDAKAVEEEEKNANAKADSDKQLREEKTLSQQMKTNDYLAILTDLTEKNDRRLTEKDESESRGIISRAYGMGERALTRTGQGGSKIGGGLGDIMKGFREMGLSLKSKKEYVTGGFSSNIRKKKIDNITKKINKDKALLSAEQDKVDRLRKSGASESQLNPYLKNMSRRKAQVRLRSSEFGDVTAKEYLYQKGRSDKNYRGMDKAEKGLLYDQTRRNISRSVMSDVKGIESPKINSAGVAGGIGAAGSPKSRTKQKKESALLFNTPISGSTNPSTYGEYIAGIYNELESLNDSIDGIRPTERESQQSGSSGFVSGILGGLLPMVAGVVMRPLSRMLKPLGRMMKRSPVGRSLRNRRAAKYTTMRQTAKGRAALKASRAAKATRASKGLLRMGTKTGLKTGVKTGVKTGAKTGAKTIIKKIPLLGALAGLGFAGYEALNGNWGRAGLELASGAAGTLPGLGTAASFAIDAGLAADDLGAFDKPTGKRPPRSTHSNLRNKPNRRYVAPSSSDSDNTPTSARIKRQTMTPRTTMSGIRSVTSRENQANMEMQARLIGIEVAKIYGTPSYLDSQNKIAKIQGKSVAEATFG